MAATRFKAGNGKFVRKDNPIAVIGRLNQRVEARRATATANARADRLAAARRHGYTGPLTRDELAKLAAGL